LLNSNYQLCLRAIALSAVLSLPGCIAHAPGSGGGQQQRIVVTVSPNPISIAFGATQQFTAAVTGNSNTAVTWSVSSTANCGGLIDSASGLYTAPAPPATIPVSPCQVTITATSKADNTTTGQALANVHVVVTVSPTTDTMGQAANLQFTATVTGTSNQAVNWGAACTACASGQGGGAFDPNNPGLYIAPPFEQGVTTPQTVSISATSAFDQNQVATATVTVQQSDPVDTMPTFSQLPSCPGGGVSGGTCYQINTTCDGVAPWSAYLKVNTPQTPPTPLGTVIFGIGTGGSGLYDNDPDFFYGTNNDTNGGAAVVNGVLTAGYTTVQISFGAPFNNTNTENGWLQGPGGVRRLACRYATVADWIFKNQQVLNSSTPTSAPMCATGNSGGSGAIGYALTVYGLASEFAMVEPTSGPVMTRIDQGCSPQGNPSNSYGGKTACTNPLNLDMSYSTAGSSDGTAGIIDTAYQSEGSTTPTPCSDGVNGKSTANNLRFQSDSIDYAPSKAPAILIPNPPTNVNVVFGGQDSSNAVAQGETWWASIGTMGGPKATQACVQDAPHAIPAAPLGHGVTQIVNDITTLCVAH
jgi:hypothetical protein